jgi:hypothetical protein
MAMDEPARSLFVQAQGLLMLAGRMWIDREEYQRMDAFKRVAESVSHSRAAEVEPWRALAGERRFAEAAELLRPTADSYSGLGAYAVQGYSAEEIADDAAKNGDTAWARSMYEQAMRTYLLYSLFPGRGDSEDYGLGMAEEVLKKLERLE